ncbi:MAG: hypothetical protein PHT44_04120 [Candidatus Portnoybacteria bacterium]|nr:hypothetical protein [Candidatus Portnoybacteria bacterium]MDD4983191.1 hypothetical protein [Candidatus Portnoybacteria bacterium]
MPEIKKGLADNAGAFVFISRKGYFSVGVRSLEVALLINKKTNMKTMTRKTTTAKNLLNVNMDILVSSTL